MGLQTEPQRTRRDPLNRDRVLRAAVELADREGLDSLSMRRVGQELGVEAMSLYNHVASKDDLLDGMVDVVIGEIDPPTQGPDWKPILRARILSARQALLRHRWASDVIVSRRSPTPQMLAYMDSMAEIVRAGLSLDLTHHAFHVLGSRILGFTQELFDDSGQPGGNPDELALMVQQMAIHYPHIAEIAAAASHEDETVVGSGCDDQYEFEFGLDIILDGFDRLSQRRNTAAGTPLARP
jgi:AcrR family transcriptional regulator